MKSETERLIIDGNTIYELDLECLKRKAKPGNVGQKSEKSAQKKANPAAYHNTKKSGQRN